MKLTEKMRESLRRSVGRYLDLDDIVDVIDYKKLEKGRFEMVVFNCIGEEKPQFFIIRDKEVLVYGDIAAPKTAWEVLALYIDCVEKERITHEAFREVKLRTRQEFHDEILKR